LESVRESFLPAEVDKKVVLTDIYVKKVGLCSKGSKYKVLEGFGGFSKALRTFETGQKG